MQRKWSGEVKLVLLEKLNMTFLRDTLLNLFLKPKQLNILQLKRPNHIRAFFTSETNWEGTFLIP